MDGPAKKVRGARSAPDATAADSERMVETGLFCQRAQRVLVAGRDDVRVLEPAS